MSLQAASPGMSTTRESFNIRLWFAGASFVVIVAIGALFAHLMSQFVAARLLEHEAQVSQEFLQSVVLAERGAEQAFRGDTPSGRAALATFANRLVTMPGIFRANIYAESRGVLWSTDRELVGRRFLDNHELEAAFAGQIVTEIGEIGAQDPKAEHAALGRVTTGRFIEAYIPIKNDDGRVVAVVEFYKAPTALFETISRAQKLIWLFALAAGLLLFATLFWIVQRGARVIERQQARLVEMEAMAAVGQMASAIAHSLRNPLASVRSSAELLAAERGESVKETVGDIVGQVDRMNLYVRDLLHYARSEGAAVEPVDPLDVGRDCIAQAGAEIARRRIDVRFEDARGARKRIAADPALLAQAMTSVVTNAIEAMQEGGRLTLRAESDGHGRRLRLTIADSGRGMSAETLASASRPFFTTKAQGLGIGLAIARRIVERFGGRLVLESELGRGTRATFDFAAEA